jgi:threonine dehydratase
MDRQVLPPSSAQLEAARRVVADHLEPTPTTTLDVRGRRVLAKLESLQPTGSFKIRGALSALDAIRRDDPGSAVITSSAGNHGLGIAHAAMILGVRAVVVVPKNASAAKVKKLRGYDVELIQEGHSYDDAQRHARELALVRSLHFVSPFNHTDVIAGQATMLHEMLDQAPQLEHLVVSVGGGGLISGSLLTRAERGLDQLRVTGVQPEHSAAMYHVLRGVAMHDVQHRPTIADGLAGGGDEDAVTNSILAELAVPLVLVPEDQIRAAVREGVETHGLVMEGSASASLAAITLDLINDRDSQVGFVLSGRNIAHELLVEILSAD